VRIPDSKTIGQSGPSMKWGLVAIGALWMVSPASAGPKCRRHKPPCRRGRESTVRTARCSLFPESAASRGEQIQRRFLAKAPHPGQARIQTPTGAGHRTAAQPMSLDSSSNGLIWYKNRYQADEHREQGGDD
jgi:hypothetical protein